MQYIWINFSADTVQLIVSFLVVLQLLVTQRLWGMTILVGLESISISTSTDMQLSKERGLSSTSWRNQELFIRYGRNPSVFEQTKHTLRYNYFFLYLLFRCPMNEIIIYFIVCFPDWIIKKRKSFISRRQMIITTSPRGTVLFAREWMMHKSFLTYWEQWR